MTRIDELANRIAELEALAAAEGLVLPMPAGVIARYECEGAAVDLRTGEVLWGCAGQQVAPGPALYAAAGLYADDAGEGTVSTKTNEFNDTVLTRLDTVIERDPAARAAIDALWSFKAQFDVGGPLADLDVHGEMDGALIDMLYAVRAAAWLDGFACGRDPLLLVFQTGAECER